MGNYCCQNYQYPEQKILSKISISTQSTTLTQFDSVDSMKKHSGKLLKFLQQENLKVFSSPILGIEIVSELGKGGQSKVFEVVLQHDILKQSSDNHDEVEKKKIAVKRTNLERQRFNKTSLELSKKLTTQNQCPFIMSGIFSFSCEKYMYSGMKIAQGGDLASFLERWRGKGNAFRSLRSEGIKMVFAGVTLGLEYLHSNNFIYCDLKIDNVLIDQNGYPLLADFQLISNLEKIPREQFQGTITAMGPQIHVQEQIDKGIDLWALGVLLYMITYNEAPFTTQEISKASFVDLCIQKQGKHGLKSTNTPESLNNLINSLLKVHPKERLGYGSIAQIKNHQFFDNFDWCKYQRRELKNPLAKIVQKFPLKHVNRRKTTNNDEGLLKMETCFRNRKNTN